MMLGGRWRWFRRRVHARCSVRQRAGTGCSWGAEHPRQQPPRPTGARGLIIALGSLPIGDPLPRGRAPSCDVNGRLAPSLGGGGGLPNLSPRMISKVSRRSHPPLSTPPWALRGPGCREDLTAPPRVPASFGSTHTLVGRRRQMRSWEKIQVFQRDGARLNTPSRREQSQCLETPHAPVRRRSCIAIPGARASKPRPSGSRGR